jgi:hypothetical protein
MILVLREPPTVRLESGRSTSEGWPIGITHHYGLLLRCPVCRVELPVSDTYHPTTSDQWDSRRSLYKWRLDDVSGHLEWLVNNLRGRSYRCEGCGTGGGLTKSDAETLLRSLSRVLTPDSYRRMLADLGFSIQEPEEGADGYFIYEGATFAARTVSA